MKSSRGGFSLIELICVLAVIGILMSMLLPAVQHVRETSRRTQCAANLKQIVTAFHEHEETHRFFPGAIVDHGGWFSQILPNIEQHARRTNGTSDEPIPLYACPSDPWAHGRIVLGDLSYKMSQGTGGPRKDGFYAAEPFRPIKPSDVTDGLSNTMALSEQLTLPDPLSLSSIEFTAPQLRRRLVRLTASYLPNVDAFADECEQRSTLPVNGLAIPTEYNHIQTPNNFSCLNGPTQSPLSPYFIASTATSLHPDGVNCAMGDGSVKFVVDAIDRNVWRALGTRDGGEQVGF